MERCEDDNIGIIPFHQYYTDDFGLIDFMDEANFDDHFIDLIRGETHVVTNPIHDDLPIFNSCNFDQSSVVAVQPPPPPPVELFDFDVAVGHVASADDNDKINPDFGLLNACQNRVEVEEMLMDDDDDDDEEDDSSGSGNTTTTPQGKKGGGKGDRSRTLVSERRRRSRMKEKLYALRSLVPNITKMDKASIVGDAVSYVQDLQMRAKKLRSEIAGLDSSLTNGGDKHQHTAAQNGRKPNHLTSFYPLITKKILKMDVVEVEEREFYVKIVSNKAKGVAMLLHRALESLTSFDVRSSNLGASADQNYVFTFTLHTKQRDMEVNLQSVKVWIATVFLNQGFEFQTISQSA